MRKIIRHLDCTIEDCNKKQYALDLCELHYRRKRQGFDMSAKRRPHKLHGMTGTPEHRAWISMRRRCYLETNKHYSHYGGRGIKVCDEWLDNFPAFYAYMGDRPTLGHSIDRINVDGNYEPGNVRWATQAEQVQNTTRLGLAGFRGIKSQANKWSAQIMVEGIQVALYGFNTKEEAANAYDCLALSLYGNNALTNFEYV